MSECFEDLWWGEEPPCPESELSAEELARWREIERDLAVQGWVDDRVWEFDSATSETLSLRLHALNDRAAVADAHDRVLLAGLRALQPAKAALAAQELELVAELTARRAPATQGLTTGTATGREMEMQLRAVADEIAVETGMTRYAATKLQDASCN